MDYAYAGLCFFIALLALRESYETREKEKTDDQN